MDTIIYIILAIIATLITFRYYVDKNESNKIYKLLDNYGAIQILDNQGLIAILYKDRTIDWIKEISLFKMIKIKEVSDHFEKEYEKLKNEEDNSCL